MKNQTKKVLQKTGVILAMVMLFTMLAVPAWATSESNSGGDTTVPGVFHHQVPRRKLRRYGSTFEQFQVEALVGSCYV